MIKLRILRWEAYLGLYERIQCNHKSRYKKKARGLQRGNMTMEEEVRAMQGYKPRNLSSLSKLKKARDEFFPRALLTP